ncbi:MAG: ribonuclease PH [Pseudomonadota bacterium]|nr:ribonuclease PH [Pseudomonadota bacterium]
MQRKNNRAENAFRPLNFLPNFTKHAEGSVLATCGDTKVICNASVQEGTPKFLRDSQQGWLTAEYSMLPRATHTRCDRESTRGKQTGRTIEIQRLIGRCLRNSIDLKKLGDFTVLIDCDVIQADGGTRTTAINGAMVALMLAMRNLQYNKIIKNDPISYLITACSLGMLKKTVLLDLDYDEDSMADVDCNICLSEQGNIIEIQGSAEGKSMPAELLNTMLEYAQKGQGQILNAMQEALAK